MSKLKTCLTRLAIGALSVMAFSSHVAAAEWKPTRPMTLLVPYTPGAGADITARIFAEKLAQAMGQPVIVENRGGAGGQIGTAAGAAAAPDGYTLIWGSDVAFTINPQLRKTPYDPIKDFAPVSLLVNLPMMLVTNPSRVEPKTLADFIADAKANPGKYAIASAGNGSSHHFAAEMFKHAADIDLLHVPYKGAAEAVTDVVGGQVDMMFVSPASVLPYIESGKMLPLGMSVPERLAVVPQVPPMAEAGLPGFNVGIWMGVLYPAKTPEHIVNSVNAEFSKILETPEIQKRIAELGYTPGGGTPQVLEERMAKDMATYGKLIKDAGIKIE